MEFLSLVAIMFVIICHVSSWVGDLLFMPHQSIILDFGWALGCIPNWYSGPFERTIRPAACTLHIISLRVPPIQTFIGSLSTHSISLSNAIHINESRLAIPAVVATNLIFCLDWSLMNRSSCPCGSYFWRMDFLSLIKPTTYCYGNLQFTFKSTPRAILLRYLLILLFWRLHT